MKRMQVVDPAEFKSVPTFLLQLVGAGQPLLHVSRDGLHALSLWLGLHDDADTWTKPTSYPRQELMLIKVFPSQPPFSPDPSKCSWICCMGPVRLLPLALEKQPRAIVGVLLGKGEEQNLGLILSSLFTNCSRLPKDQQGHQ